VGLARTGGIGYTFSGDIFLAFATGNHMRRDAGLATVQTLPLDQINPLFEATAEAVEEAILNALVAAETITGQRGRVAPALPHDLLQAAMRRWRRLD
jgi:D-aminopeptidase